MNAKKFLKLLLYFFKGKVHNCKKCGKLDFNEKDGYYCKETSHYLEELLGPCDYFKKIKKDEK